MPSQSRARPYPGIAGLLVAGLLVVGDIVTFVYLEDSERTLRVYHRDYPLEHKSVAGFVARYTAIWRAMVRSHRVDLSKWIPQFDALHDAALRVFIQAAGSLGTAARSCMRESSSLVGF